MGACQQKSIMHTIPRCAAPYIVIITIGRVAQTNSHATHNLVVTRILLIFKKQGVYAGGFEMGTWSVVDVAAACFALRRSSGYGTITGNSC